MAKKIAVAAIHGIGSFRKRPDNSADPSFSADLKSHVRRIVERRHPGKFDPNVAWREIFYSDITEKNQNDYFDKVKRRLRYDSMREFVIKNLGDAAAYHSAPGDPNHDVYRDIHDRVDDTLTELEADTDPGSPMIVLAHSMGGHVMSNHIWDCQADDRLTLPRVSSCNTISAFVTFGCNIPLFTFAYSASQMRAIDDPSTGLADKYRRKTWWLNFYDKDDILGYPLGDLGGEYTTLSANRELVDRPINSGNWFQSWNPLSHSGYWRDYDFTSEVAKIVGHLLNRV